MNHLEQQWYCPAYVYYIHVQVSDYMNRESNMEGYFEGM